MSSRRTAAGIQTIDPFYAFLDLRQVFSSGEVFLLDAAQDLCDPRYRMSLIGVAPVLEIQVKDGRVTLYALPGLREYVDVRVRMAGFRRVSSGPIAPSVLPQPSASYGGIDPMVFLETVRQAVRALFPNPDVEPFASGFLGYIGYDAVHYLERLPSTTLDDRGLPDIRLQWHAAVFQLRDGEVWGYNALHALQTVLEPEAYRQLEDRVGAAQRVMEERTAQSVQMHPLLSALSTNLNPAPLVNDVTEVEFVANVKRAKEYIRAGDVFQVVLSKRMHAEKRLHPYLAYDRLRRLNPSPYMFMAEYPEMRLFGASPEVQFRAVGGVAEMKPIAGTSKGRGRTPEEDEQLRRRLLQDDKERAEHVMLVDLCRNDLGRVCEVGSVHVVDLMTVEPYSHLFHLVSTVRGRLRADVSIFQALLATFPAGTLTGAPKIRAMEIIDELERYRRGPYGGLVGMVDIDANANTAIIIRTVVECRDHYYVQVGAGIVADSDPHQEWLECSHKAGALMDVLSRRA